MNFVVSPHFFAPRAFTVLQPQGGLDLHKRAWAYPRETWRIRRVAAAFTRGVSQAGMFPEWKKTCAAGALL